MPRRESALVKRSIIARKLRIFPLLTLYLPPSLACGRFLYNVLPGSGAVAGWRINDDGSLTKIGEFGGLPDTVNRDHAPFDFSALGSPAGIDVL